MSAWRNYECEGQMTIFDFIENQSVAESSQACPRVTENVPDVKSIEGSDTNICKLSQHTCNSSELWKVADTLDEITCPHICCNQCQEQMCGARCNGSQEPEEDVHIDRDGKSHKVPEWMDYKRCENCNRWARYTRDEQPPAGWGVYGWCNEHKDKCISVSCCSDFEDKRGK